MLQNVNTSTRKAYPVNMLDSSDLLCGKKFVIVVHNGVQYRLQTTKLGKLILVK